MKTLQFEMDGKKVTAEEGATLLDVARKNGIRIPTLCYDEKLEPYGACRMCMVEVTKGKRTKLVASCVYPAEDGIVVQTNTEKVRKIRTLVLELLWPSVNEKFVASEYGVKKSRFRTEHSDCCLCGLCARYCAEVTKRNAVFFKGRGIEREMAILPDMVAECTYCGKCFGLCTGGWIVTQGENAFTPK